MHAAATAAGFYESNRREYTIRRGDVLVPAGHVSIDGQDSLVIHNAIMDDGQVSAIFHVNILSVEYSITVPSPFRYICTTSCDYG